MFSVTLVVIKSVFLNKFSQTREPWESLILVDVAPNIEKLAKECRHVSMNVHLLQSSLRKCSQERDNATSACAFSLTTRNYVEVTVGLGRTQPWCRKNMETSRVFSLL